MAGFIESIQAYWSSVKSSKVDLPSVGPIPRAQCFPAEKVGQRIVEQNSYFTLSINELFLRHGNQLWTTYLPTVLAVADFTYSGKKMSIPAVVGPNLLKLSAGMKAPSGLVIQDTVVLGPHPFRGGKIELTVLLYRVMTDNHAMNLLECVESVSAAVGVPANVETLTKVGATITNALGHLLKLQKTVPLAGHRIELDDNEYDGITSAYFIVSTDPDLDIARLRVRSGRLFYVDDQGVERKFDLSDYVLYSLMAHSRRGNDSTLPYYDSIKKALVLAATPTKASWISAKSLLSAAYQQMVVSDDLTSAEADALLDRYERQIKEKHARAMQGAPHAMAGGEPDRIDDPVAEKVATLMAL